MGPTILAEMRHLLEEFDVWRQFRATWQQEMNEIVLVVRERSAMEQAKLIIVADVSDLEIPTSLSPISEQICCKEAVEEMDLAAIPVHFSEIPAPTLKIQTYPKKIEEKMDHFYLDVSLPFLQLMFLPLGGVLLLLLMMAGVMLFPNSTFAQNDGLLEKGDFKTNTLIIGLFEGIFETNISLLTIEEGIFEVKATAGDTLVGEKWRANRNPRDRVMGGVVLLVSHFSKGHSMLLTIIGSGNGMTKSPPISLHWKERKTKMLELRLVHGSLLKKVLEAIKDLVTEANFD